MSRLAGPLVAPPSSSELTLELARQSHAPNPADKARNLAALRQRLALPAAHAEQRHSTVKQPQSPGEQPSTGDTRTLAPWQQLLGVGIVTGALGFFLGLGVNAQRERSASAAAPLEPPLATVTVTATSEALPQSSLVDGNPQPEASGIDSTASARPAPVARAPKRRVARHTPAADATFLEAVRLLARARRALERREPALALGLLDELDTRFAPELLDEERAATRVFALCASGDRESALTLARGWFVNRPRSLYTRRLEQSCAAEALR